ncbi:MAG TPA: hypothetical protein VIK80_00255 [Flavihumibacter sp.]
MIGIFRQKNPGNALVLLIYALIVKFPIFLYGNAPLRQEDDNYLYKLLLKAVSPLFGERSYFYSVLAFLLIYLQASLLNRIANNVKLLPRPNYLFGMSFLLVSSLLPEWNQFSSTLLVNFGLIWVWYGMIGWYNNTRAMGAIFNTCLIVGILPLLYTPSIAFVVMVILGIFITRPVRIGEFLVALIGFMAPFYFLMVVMYLTDHWNPAELLPSIQFHLPRLPASLWITGGMLLLVIPFLVGGYFVQDNLNKMLIQVRKNWSLLLVIMLVGLLVILVNPGENYQHWMLSIIPIACFHAAAYFYPERRMFPLILHWILFAFAIAANYFPMTS